MTGRIAAFALVCAGLGALLEGLGFKSRRLFSVLAFVLLIGAIAQPLSEILQGLLSFSSAAGIGEGAEAAVKAVGLGYLFGFVSDICTGLGESSLASAVIIVGRLEIFLVAFPFFEGIMNLGMELLK